MKGGPIGQLRVQLRSVRRGIACRGAQKQAERNWRGGPHFFDRDIREGDEYEGPRLASACQWRRRAAGVSRWSVTHFEVIVVDLDIGNPANDQQVGDLRKHQGYHSVRDACAQRSACESPFSQSKI